ncbi:MAG: hypothetical protein MUD08_04425, partial [Cytophagales bacterium]|nr:hypothetical protein [Cytophagales bacterium]
MRATTRLSDTEQKLLSVQSRKESVIVTRRITTTDKRHSCLLTDTFTPEGGAIRWETEIAGQGKEAWSTGIQTHWQVTPDPNLRFWTTWGDPRPETVGLTLTEAEKRELLDGNVAASDRQLPVGDWADPLVPQPLLTRKFWYGGPTYGKHRSDGTMEDRMYYNPFENRNYFSVPVVSLLHKKADWGVSMAFSPENIGIEALLWTHKNGKLVFDRRNNRI